MRKAKRISDRHKKEHFSKNEKELLSLIAQLIVEVVMQDDNYQIKDKTKSPLKPSNKLFKRHSL